MSEHKRKDLTRWNRASLTQFRYVDGNAVEYLDILRQQLVERFKNPETDRCEWLSPAEKIPVLEEKLKNETLVQRQERLSRRQKRILEMYHQDRRDWAWEITRTFARACHVLTEYVDAYANEGYLGTATQWGNVRRLVKMLDYHPAPPASAATRLAIIAKENSAGIVARGFQVKNSPAPGSTKVIFETLEDIFVDSALNELRPRGWNKSDAPVVELAYDNESVQASAEEPQFSPVANEPAINLQGVGKRRAGQLNTVPGYSKTNCFRIRDFLDLDPDAPGIVIAEGSEEDQLGTTWLREFKAKATVISNFELEPGWSNITNYSLSDIASGSVALLAETTGQPLDKVKALQLRIELIGVYLDQTIYEKTELSHLLAPAAGSQEPDSVPTFWHAKRKPKVKPGQVAIIFHESENKAEAATIARVNETNGMINLRPSTAQYSWQTWRKSEASLYVSPRWQQKCWLNGSAVVRTVEPHGLSAGAHIGWKQNNRWKFAKVIEADKRGLRLNLTEPLPDPTTQLYEARPLQGPNLPAEIKEVGLVDEELPADAIESMTAARLLDHETPVFPQIISSGPTDSINPLSLIPGIFGKLPEVGSFIVPTPMLPMDLVKAAVKILLKIGVMVIPSTGEPIFEFVPPDELAKTIYDLVAESDSVQWENTDEVNVRAAIEAALILPRDAEPVFFKIVKQVYLNRGPFLIIPEDSPIKAVVASAQPQYVVNGGSDKVEAGDWVVARFSDGLRALKISAINEFIDSDKTESFSLSFENLIGNEGELQKIYADFRAELIAEGAAVNDTEVEPEIELEDVPESLKVGREVLLTAEGQEPVAAKIEFIEGNTIKTNPSAPGFIKGNLIILGNVIQAGHGERKSAKILGSGDASKSNQEFTLEVEGVAFTPDATKSAGVAAAIEVEVAGRIWEQVSTLNDSASGDHHYAIRMTEAGHVKIIFGDGNNGRRLPSGKNNIRARYRVGSGTAGNVPAGALEKPVNLHPLVKAIQHPLLAAGGGDMEDVASLREHAPPTLLSLERAVSLSDFSHLAAAQSSIWQARAYSQILQDDRTESVMVVIVPAGGIKSPEINNAIQTFLQKHALPGVQVTVDDCIKVRFNLSITLRVITDEFVVTEVEKAVISALSDRLSLKNSKLGKHFYLSEVYKIVESIKGVKSSICVLNNDKSLQVIKSNNESTVIYLGINAKENPSVLSVATEEYRP